MKTKGGARPGAGRKPTLISESRAITLWQQGVSKKEIAKKFGVAYQVMRYFFKKKKMFKRGELKTQEPPKPH
jgi:transposase